MFILRIRAEQIRYELRGSSDPDDYYAPIETGVCGPFCDDESAERVLQENGFSEIDPIKRLWEIKMGNMEVWEAFNIPYQGGYRRHFVAELCRLNPPTCDGMKDARYR